MRRPSTANGSTSGSSASARDTASAARPNGASARRSRRQSPGADRNWRFRSEGTFQGRVYAIVRLIPEGRIITYGAIAAVLGEPRRAREVGWAMAVCPEGAPYQRVINARGEISAGGDAVRRRKALEADGVVFLQDGRVDLDRYLWLPEDGSGDGASTSKQA